MNFQDIKIDFLNNINEGEFYDSSQVTYSRKLDVFYEYLTNNFDINNHNHDEIISSLEEQDILDSIDYYVRENNIKFKITVENYRTVIKEYFDFISKKYNLNNVYFDSTKLYSLFIEKSNDKIKNLGLKKSKQKAPITQTLCHEIINYCDENIEKFDIASISSELTKKSNKYKEFNLFLSAFITKLVILTGVKNNVLNKIKISDYDVKLNTIIINNFKIHLPNNLGLQMEKYILARNEITKINGECNAFFIDKNGKSINTNYTVAFYISKELINNNSGESLAKYTIIEFIKKGININLLKEFTGFGELTFMHCQEILNEEKNKEDIIAKNRYIDSKIRSIEIYDKL